MKRIFISAFGALALCLSSYGQGEMDLFNMSKNDLRGTARSTAMGGAFGALGGDITGISINPAGIGVYKTSEIVTTLNFTNNKYESTTNAGKTDHSKFVFNFDNMAFVGVLPVYSDIVESLNFGFSYNRLKSFDRKYEMKSQNLNSSLVDYMNNKANISRLNGYDVSAANPFRNGANWLGALAYQGGLIESINGVYQPKVGAPQYNNLYVREKGEINSYDFSAGTTFSDMISVGLTLSVTDINYHLYSDYYEDFGNNGDFYLENFLSTEGTGYQVSIGVIAKPINELRLGIAYHSPTWYKMTDYYSAIIDALGNRPIDTFDKAGDTYVDYDMQTPDRWTFSIAGIIGQQAIISADYELTNYRNMRFRNIPRYDSELSAQNGYVKEDYKNASTFRIGAEVRFTPQISGRIGYAWMQSPIDKDLKNFVREVPTVGTIPHFRLEGDTNYFTYGIGYRFTPYFYTDIAFIMKSQTDDLYTYSRVYDDGSTLIQEQPKTKLKNNMFSGLLTLGYRF